MAVELAPPDGCYTSDPTLIRDELLNELFESQADARPHNIAIDCAGKTITYAELDRRANRLARWLHGTGVGPGSFVGILLPRSADVYVTILAILKTGAAYVPLDPDYPTDRIAYILADCQVHSLVTTSAFAKKHSLRDGTGPRIVALGEGVEEFAAQSFARLTRQDTGARPQNVCYVIYTSGSTGRPKGVEITHQSACHLVRAEGAIFSVTPADRVYQGFSIAFDASVEEVWLALFSGAAIVVGTADMVHAGPALSKMLTDAGVTVLSCVPTLLSMMPDDVPGVRLLIVGGEACPQDLVRRWARPGRRMVNTYGPTEATVIATFGDLRADAPVTIGRPVSNYRVYILDDQMQPVPNGEAGELHIGGIGLARGYLGRPDLTAEKFVPNAFLTDASEKLYKSGDLVRFTPAGEIEFLGRIDTQVKLRGFRIELAEIESALMKCPGVQSAVVCLNGRVRTADRFVAGTGSPFAAKPDGPQCGPYGDLPAEGEMQIQQLAGYVVLREGAHFSEAELRSGLRSLLPGYMIPATIDDLPALPTLPSGKVDRKSLPAPGPRERVNVSDDPPRTPREKVLAAAWEQLFAPAVVSRSDDFFMELGGHSLLAATMVSRLRQTPDFHDLSVLDVYNYPTIASLAAELDQRRERDSTTRVSACAPAKVSRLRYFLCSLAQLPCLYVLLALYAVQWLAPYVMYSWRINRGLGIGGSLALSFASMVVVPPAMLLIALAAKWLIIGRYKPGRHPVWGLYFLRWWFVDKIIACAPVGFLAGTPLLNYYLRLMGAKIGRGAHLASDDLSAFDLISIGERSILNTEASLVTCSVEDGWLKLGRIDIRQDCSVGIRSVVCRDSILEDGALLGDMSMLPPGGRIPMGESWLGSPAKPLPRSSSPREVKTHAQPSAAWMYALLYAAGVIILPMIYLLAIFPGMMALAHLDRTYDTYWFLFASPLAALSFVVLLCLQIAAFKWILLGRVKSGRHNIFSLFYARKWFFDHLMGLSLDVMGSLYSTLYLAPWFRMLGAKLGRNAEISTATSACPDLLEIGDESFIADYVSLGAARVEKGQIVLAPTQIGKRAFIGNSAMVPIGTKIGDGALIGVLSTPPLSSPGAARADTSWLGSPAIFLPQRIVNQNFSEESTFKPTAKLYAQRYLIEFARVVLPMSVFVTLTTLLIHVVIVLRDRERMPVGQIAALFPLLYLVCGFAASLFVIAAKWILMGRYKPVEKPLWSTFVWRTELLTALHENLANAYLVELLSGTPWVCWFFRLMGAKIGKRAFLDTTFLTEFDLIDIGDDAALNDSCTIQTHLFEDRVMKMSTIRIGAGCSVGTGSVVLYDTAMEPGAALGDLSLLMKGESLPAGTRWEGTPARMAVSEHAAPAATERILEPALT